MKKSRPGQPVQHEPKPPMVSLLAQILRGERRHALKPFGLGDSQSFSFVLVMVTKGYIEKEYRPNLIRAFLDWQKRKGNRMTALQCVFVFRVLDRVKMALRFIKQTNGLCEEQRVWFDLMKRSLLSLEIEPT